MLQINKFPWRTVIIYTLLLTITIVLACAQGNLHSIAFGQSGTDLSLRYEIDRSQVPALYFNDLTLNVVVGQVDSVQVLANGMALVHEYDSANGTVSFTTDAALVDIDLTGVENVPDLAAVTKATLKDNKDFAWSLGMDDNIDLKEAVSALESYGWAGTIFMIGDKIDDTRDEDWIIDAPYLRDRLENGWSIGNHGWTSTCADDISQQDRSQDVLEGHSRLRQIIDSSAVPTYQIITFAAPCFVEEYHPVILDHRNSQTWSVQFNESGARSTLILDPGATEFIVEHGDITRSADIFDYDLPVGRDGNLDAADTQYVTDFLDWMVTQHATRGVHLWHNSLIHGNKQDAVGIVADYIYNTYGPNGTDQAWVAPSDQVYSYLLIRDRSVVRLLNSNELPNTPTPTHTSTPTPTNTPTATHTPTPTNTYTPTDTPTTTPTDTDTPTPTHTYTPTNTPTSTSTPTDTPTPTHTHTPTDTPTSTPTSTPIPTQTANANGNPTSSGDSLRSLHLPIVLQGDSQ